MVVPGSKPSSASLSSSARSIIGWHGFHRLVCSERRADQRVAAPIRFDTNVRETLLGLSIGQESIDVQNLHSVDHSFVVPALHHSSQSGELNPPVSSTPLRPSYFPASRSRAFREAVDWESSTAR